MITVVLAASERDCRLVAMLLTAWQGRVHEASELIQAAVQMVTGSGRGMLAGFSAYASAVLDNGLGLYDAVRDAAKPAFERDHLGFGRLMVELAEVPSWPTPAVPGQASAAGQPASPAPRRHRPPG